jgi:hypothetical protein
MWDTALVLMLRALIGDLDSSTYTDAKLQQVLVVAAFQVYNAATFPYEYTINMTTIDITPDPVESEDSDFCVLTVYKAACIIVSSEQKVKASSSFSMKDGPSALDTTSAARELMNAAKKICQEYNDLLTSYMMNGSDGGPGQAILGPYSPGADLIGWVSNNHRGWE